MLDRMRSMPDISLNSSEHTSAYVRGIDYLSAASYSRWRGDVSLPVQPCSFDAANSSNINPKVTTTNTASTG